MCHDNRSVIRDNTDKCLLEQADIVVLEYDGFKIITSQRHRNVLYMIIFLSVIKMQIEP